MNPQPSRAARSAHLPRPRRNTLTRALRRVLCATLIGGVVAVIGGAAASDAFADDDDQDTDITTCSAEHPQLIEDISPPLEMLQSLPPDKIASDQVTTATVATGKGVTVAVIDSGVAGTNEHFPDGSFAEGFSFVPEDPLPDGRTDQSGHGTTVAGIIAAREIPGSGAVGMAPEATIMPIRVYASYDKETSTVSLETIAAGVRWAADNGAKIINISISATRDNPDLRAAVAYAQAAGALIVASSGNANTAADTNAKATRYPAAYDGVLGVVATDFNFTVHDDASFTGRWVDIAAPGLQPNAPFFGGGDCIPSDKGPSSSWATAFVSGAAALVAEKFPDASPDYWAYRLMATADRALPTERDNTVGWGFVRPYEALTVIDDGALPGPINPSYQPPPRVSLAPQAATINNPPSPFRGTERVASQIAVGGVAVVVLLVLLAFRRRSRT